MRFYKSKKRKVIIAGISLLLLTSLFIWIFWANTALELNEYVIKSDKLPEAFDGYRIAHVSDLHNAQIGKNNVKLIDTLIQAQPDIIVITGDIIDSRRTDTTIALAFASEAVSIAPCYYVTGNHEARVSEYDEFKIQLSEIGVVVLDNESVKLAKSSDSVTLIGVNDPSFGAEYLLGDSETVMQSKLQGLTCEEDCYTILLSHRPELFSVYADNSIDLVFSGHAHGGQFRLPFIGGIVAPNQGLFPKYDAGIYTSGNTNMVVSRGIGNSIIPLRVNNRPEVILIELKKT